MKLIIYIAQFEFYFLVNQVNNIIYNKNLYIFFL